MTAPELSTVTRTVTLMCPWMVSRALFETRGISSCTTEAELGALPGLLSDPDRDVRERSDGGVERGVVGVSRVPRCVPCAAACSALSATAAAGGD